MRLILIWNQPLGIVPLVWTLRRWLLEQHKRGSAKKSGPPVALLGAALLSENQLKQIQDSHQAIWESGHEIMQTEQELALEEDHSSFKVKRMTEPTNYFESKRPPTRKSTHRNQRLRSMTRRKPLFNL